MSDAAPVVHIEENSPEQVAYKLLELVAMSEKKQLRHSQSKAADAGRKWILDTYAECLDAVQGGRGGRTVFTDL